MMSKQFRVYVRRFHRWIGVIIGVQLCIWIISGAYFAWLALDKVRGTDNNIQPSLLYPRPQDLFPISKLPFRENSDLKSVLLEATLRGPVYRATTRADQKINFDAFSGAELPILSATEVSRYISMQKTDISVESIALQETKIREFAGDYPVYSVSLKGSWQGRLYVDPWTGKVLATRNMFWIVYDFLWMLHIMDYKEREDFNNSLLRVLSLLSAGIIVSGYFLFTFGKAPRRTKSEA